MRSTWTDERLDEFSDRTDRNFERVDRNFERVHEELAELRGEFGALNRTLIQGAAGIIASILVGFMGLIATQL